jgi:SAM-dependent methyltransferase
VSDPAGSTAPHWFEAVADHLGPAYLRYSFTKGTEQEVDFLVDVLGLSPGDRLLDVGCGPGRHAHAFGRRGIQVHGVDISERFVALAAEGAPPGVTFERLDARALPYDGEFDAAISLCQGAFGLVGAGPGTEPAAVSPEAAPGGATPLDPDGVVLAGMARAVRPGGRVSVSAFSGYFIARYQESQDTFDADRGVNHEHTEVRDEHGAEVPCELWTSCFTPRELRLLAQLCGLVVDHVWAVSPGEYAARPPDLDHPEHLLVSHRPPA